MAQLKEKFNSNIQFLSILAGTITGYPEDVQATFTRLLSDKYLDIADKLLYTRYGERILRSEDDTIIAMEVLSYLLMNAHFYEKCLEYIDAEYDPIENYNGVEQETIDTTYDDVVQHGLDTKAQDTFQHGAHTDTYTEGFGGHDVTTHIAKTKTTSTPGTDTDTLKVSPDDIDGFHNKEQHTISHTQGTETYEKMETGGDDGNDKVSYSEKVNKDERQQYNDIAHVGGTQDSYAHYTDARDDKVVRSLYRHGNLGVTTSGQMIQGDYEVWKYFGWLSDMAHDIANLLSIGVWAV